MATTRRMRPLLGCFVEIGAHLPDLPGGEAAERLDAAVADAFGLLETAQRRWSFQDPDSELSRLNRNGGAALPLSRTTLRLLHIAKTLMRVSDAAFDCTAGGALVRQGRLPDHGGPEPLDFGRAEDIELGSDTARLARPVRLALDGIAKGFAVDLAIAALRRRGLQSAWVNAGGDARAFGPQALALQRRELDGRFTALGALQDAAIATSARTDADPSFPGHIVSASNRQPAAGVWTVLARSAWRADALTKVAACTEVARRRAEVARLGGHLVEVSG